VFDPTWLALVLGLAGVLLTAVAAVVAWLQAQSGAQHAGPLTDDIIAFRANAAEGRDWNQRVEHVRGLMTSQDTITWTVAAISFAAQAALAAFYFQGGASPSGRLGLPLVGIFAAFVLLLLVARSNWYMAAYMNMLQRTKREEYQLHAPPHFPPSATLVLYGIHAGISLAWFVLLVAYVAGL
jgi:hypothetical protein